MELLSTKKASEILGIHPNTLRKVGRWKGRSNTSKQTQVSEDLMLPLSAILFPQKKDCLCPCLQVETKKTTSQVKSEKCEAVTPTTKSSKTSEAVSTSKEKDCKPYWTPSCLEKSQKLLSLTETACVGSDLNSRIMPNKHNCRLVVLDNTALSPKPNSSKTSFPSFTFFLPTLRSQAVPSCDPRSESTPRRRTCRGGRSIWAWRGIGSTRPLNTSKGKTPRLPPKFADSNRKNTLIGHWIAHSAYMNMLFADAVGAVKNAKLKYKKTGQFQEVSWRTRKDQRCSGFGFDKNSIQEDFIFAKH